jgi:hypothetical protein
VRLAGENGIKNVVRATMLEHLALVAEKAGKIAKAGALRAASPLVFSGWTTYRVAILCRESAVHRAWKSWALESTRFKCAR